MSTRIHIDRGNGYTLCDQDTRRKEGRLVFGPIGATCRKCLKNDRMRRAFKKMCKPQPKGESHTQ